MVGTQPFICILVSLFGHFYPGERFLQSTYNGSLPDFIMLRHCHHAGLNLEQRVYQFSVGASNKTSC